MLVRLGRARPELTQTGRGAARAGALEDPRETTKSEFARAIATKTATTCGLAWCCLGRNASRRLVILVELSDGMEVNLFIGGQGAAN